MELSNLNIKNGLCISLGANIDSKFGEPIETLIKCRPVIEDLIEDWISHFTNQDSKSLFSDINFSWSSIYRTNPHGILEPQPNYLNTILLVKSTYLLEPSIEEAKLLLKGFKTLEKEYGRDIFNQKKWIPRCLDLDILWWENLICKDSQISLPHPRFVNRNFVITPLAEILNRDQRVEKIKDLRWPI